MLQVLHSDEIGESFLLNYYQSSAGMFEVATVTIGDSLITIRQTENERVHTVRLSHHDIGRLLELCGEHKKTRVEPAVAAEGE